jgi:hypothetical protein
VYAYEDYWRNTMVDLRERLKEVEQNDSLDLWDEIAARAPSYDERSAPLRSRVVAGVVAAAIAIAGFTLVYASFGRSPTDVTSAAPTQAPARVDLVEAGIRAVAHPADVLFIETSLCRPEPGRDDCPAAPFTDDEVRTLADRLRDLSGDIRFVRTGADIPGGANPDAFPDVEFVFVGIPHDQGDGTFWIEANVICRGACGRGGGTYVLEKQNGVWTSTGRAPGTPRWGSS